MLLTESRLRKIIAEEYKLMMKEAFKDPADPHYKDRPLSKDKGTGIRPPGQLPGLEDPARFGSKTKPAKRGFVEAYRSLMNALDNPEQLMNAIDNPESSPLGEDIKTLKADKTAAHSAKFKIKGLDYLKADEVYRMLFPQQSTMKEIRRKTWRNQEPEYLRRQRLDDDGDKDIGDPDEGGSGREGRYATDTRKAPKSGTRVDHDDDGDTEN